MAFYSKMEVLLDSSFIISCVRKRIDFFDELSSMGFKPTFPREVLEELKDLKASSRLSRADKSVLDIAFQMIDFQKVKKMRLGKRVVDEGLIAKGKEGIYIATLDKVIKRNVPNRIVIDSARNCLKIERD